MKMMPFVELRIVMLVLGLNLFVHVACGQHWRLQNGREVIQLGNETGELTWVVQLSDLHVSVFNPDRASSFEELVGPMLALIKPALVLITGDLTDAKNKDLSKMRQDEAEWIAYKDVIDTCIRRSGLPLHAFFDLRGNHDKFGVPEIGGHLDYFSKYSISALMNRTTSVQSVTLLGSGWRHLFVGFDDSMAVGLRGPCNLYGHPTDELLQILDSELSQWDGHQNESITKTVFGHFPMSFTTSTDTKKRPENIFVKHSISSYLCGHLHTKFGNNLFKHYLQSPYQHRERVSESLFLENGSQGTKHREFWEWEMGDWKKSRMMRIIMIDGGHVSFLDVDLSNLNPSSHDMLTELPTIVLPTYPLDSRMMQRATGHHLFLGSIRSVVFSPQPVISATAKIFDSVSIPYILMEELKMEPLVQLNSRGVLFTAAWNSNKYLDPYAGRYLLQIEVIDLHGKHTFSTLRPFSANGKIGQLKWTWSEFFVMGIVWDNAYPKLMWIAFALLLTLLLPPKICFLFFMRHRYYNKWVSSIFKSSSRKGLDFRKFLKVFWWASVQSCEDQTMWWSQQFFVVYLIFFPWFWGQVLGEGYPLGYMSATGWTAKILGKVNSQSHLGVPDVMVVVLPHLYFIVFPLFLLISALSAERSFFELHSASLKSEDQWVMEDVPAVTGEHLASLSANGYMGTRQKILAKKGELGMHKMELRSIYGEKKHKSSCKLCRRWVRIGLYVGCIALALAHGKRTYSLMRAYGAEALLMSPGLALPIPLLLTTSIYRTSHFRKWTCQFDKKDIR
eukprot:c23740_g1_i1 orf=282-2642(-)